MYTIFINYVWLYELGLWRYSLWYPQINQLLEGHCWHPPSVKFNQLAATPGYAIIRKKNKIVILLYVKKDLLSFEGSLTVHSNALHFDYNAELQGTSPLLFSKDICI